MSPLPTETTNPTFTISWSGIDAVGEIDHYSILVSTDGGPFQPFLEKTKTTSVPFTGQVGKNYGFLCIAADTAGNIEVQSATAEATTRVVALPPVPGDLNGDRKVDCADLNIVKASFGKRAGQPGFDARADVNKDGIVDIRDLTFVSRLLPAGTTCP